MEGYRPSYEYEPEIESREIDPNTPLGQEVWKNIYPDLEEESFPFSTDNESMEMISPEQIDQAIMGAIAGKNLGEVAELMSEDANDLVSERMRRIGRRIGISLAVTQAYTGVDGSWATIEPLPGSVAGTYRKGTNTSEGIEMDIDGIMSDDWERMIIHVLTHEITHLKTRGLISDIDQKDQSIKIHARTIMTATEVIEAMTEKRASQLTGHNIAYHTEQAKLAELVGEKNVAPLIREFVDNNTERVEQILSQSVAERHLGVEAENAEETPEESLVGFRDSPVRERIMVAGVEYEIASGEDGPNIAMDLGLRYGEYLSDDDIEMLIDVEEIIQSAVEQAWATDEREVILEPELQVKIDHITAKLHAVDLCEETGGIGREFEDLKNFAGTGNPVKDHGFRAGVRKWITVNDLKRAERIANGLVLN